ncbi:MAG: hypothetical protein K2J73_04715 [Oscillospiraceae bacterium]|nr:hypothetical protein [Oscillospiraceae bacterium]
MQKRIKKLIACLCCLAMMVPLCAIPASSDSEPAEETSSSDSDAPMDEDDYAMDDDEPLITDEQAMAEMKLAVENDKLALWYNDKDITLALQDKNTGKIWWSNPINADASAGRAAQKQELNSGLTLVFGEPAARRTTQNHSKARSTATMKATATGLEVTYDFSQAEIVIPVVYTLHDDYMSLNVVTADIDEKTASKITTNLTFMSTFGAADTEEEGYFVIPDGSGAVINFNNGKAGYRVYKGKVYGRDITAVSTTKPTTSRQVYLPMYGIVKGDSGMMVVADKGDTCASINAYVAGQKRTSYNSCYFDFEIRTSDEYLMGGEANPLRVFERRGILVPEIEVRYYPVSNSDKSAVDYTDIANAYKNYLKTSQGVEKSQAADNSALYIDLYGATLKQETVLGFPVTMQHKTTTFSDAKNILEQLKGLGVDNMVVNYNQWTTADIKEKVSDKAKPASILGGKSDFDALMNYAKSNNITVYPEVDNLTFKSGSGYFTMTDTAIRVSNAYSRQIEYDLAHGVENKFYDAMSLLSPRKYAKMFTNLSKSYSKYGLDTISLGSATTVIYGDYGKNSVSREMFKTNLQGYMEELKASVPSILADGANAYVLKYVDHVTNVPLNSSKYDVFDGDIPLYQIVMSGLKPVSTTAVNGDAQVADLVLRAIACGSNLRFDFTAETADELKDTRYDVLYYSNYEYWLEDAAGCYKFANEVLSQTAGAEITDYNILSDSEIETVYSNGTTTRVNLNDKTVTVNGKTISIYDYVGEEAIG